jgi:hypothetical protein
MDQQQEQQRQIDGKPSDIWFPGGMCGFFTALFLCCPCMTAGIIYTKYCHNPCRKNVTDEGFAQRQSINIDKS